MNTISSILKFIAENIAPICGTQTANKVLASPNGSSGAPAFRSLVPNDLPAVSRPPVGTIQMFAGASAPTGWLLCNGQAVSRLTYSSLFNVIGTAYGSGDGSATFNLPDLRDRVPVGAGTTYSRNSQGGANTRSHSHTGVIGGTALTTAQIPSHTHGTATLTGWFDLRKWGSSGYMVVNNGGTVSQTSVSTSANNADNAGTSDGLVQRISINDTHTHSAVGGNGTHTHSFSVESTSVDVRQPYLGVYFIIYTGVA